MMHLLKSYVWLLGDGSLLLIAVYELWSLRDKPVKSAARQDREPPA